MNHIDSFGLNNLNLNLKNNNTNSSSSSSSSSSNDIDNQLRRLYDLLKTTRELYDDSHEETIKIHKKITSLLDIE